MHTTVLLLNLIGFAGSFSRVNVCLSLLLFFYYSPVSKCYYHLSTTEVSISLIIPIVAHHIFKLNFLLPFRTMSFCLANYRHLHRRLYRMGVDYTGWGVHLSMQERTVLENLLETFAWMCGANRRDAKVTLR